MLFATFRIRKTLSIENYLSGRVQCTRWQLLTGENTPAAPVVPPPLLLIYSSNLGQFKYIKTNEYADTMRQNGKPQA